MVCSDEKERHRFDEAYEVVLSAVMSARESAKELRELWLRHSEAVSTGRVARVQDRTIQVDESIDKELRERFESFVNASVRAVKTGMQRLLDLRGVNIGFLFQSDTKFQTQLAVVTATDPKLAEYLRRTLKWSEPLVTLRNEVEHEGWILPKVTYSRSGPKIIAHEPTVKGAPLSEYAGVAFDRIACLVEELTTYSLMRALPPLVTLTETPVADRSGSAPERFRVALASATETPWQLDYRDVPFDKR